MKQTGGQYDSGCSLADLQRKRLEAAIHALGAYRRVMDMPDGKDVRGAVLDAAMQVLVSDEANLP